MAEIRNLTRLEDVYAMQLISESLSSSHGYSHEMNFVLRDGNRINVTDHTREDGMRADAEKLSAFLGIPVWDAIIWKKRT